MGNKFAISIKLKKNNGIDINFIHWDKRFLTNYSNSFFGYFESSDKNFCMYSHDEIELTYEKDNIVFVIPDAETMDFKSSKITHKFNTDGDRKDFLKNLHKYLCEWADTWGEFRYEHRRNGFIHHNEFWIY